MTYLILSRLYVNARTQSRTCGQVANTKTRVFFSIWTHGAASLCSSSPMRIYLRKYIDRAIRFYRVLKLIAICFLYVLSSFSCNRFRNMSFSFLESCCFTTHNIIFSIYNYFLPSLLNRYVNSRVSSVMLLDAVMISITL